MAELKPCPFCGGEAGVVYDSESFKIAGCLSASMICPNPKIIVYKNDFGDFDYKWWNQRETKKGEK